MLTLVGLSLMVTFTATLPSVEARAALFVAGVACFVAAYRRARRR